MEAKDVLKELRQRHNMTQDQLAEKLAVTRQAVSRWENGESVPNPETLKQLSALFDTSINHLLGDPRKLICQCCGMPLDSDEVISRDLDGSFNEDYCKGAIPTASSPMTAWNSSWSFSSPICPTSSSLRSRPEPISIRCCQS